MLGVFPVTDIHIICCQLQWTAAKLPGHTFSLLDLHALSAGLESSKQAAAGSKQNTKPPGWAVSFPPLVAWPHAAEPDEGTPEAALLDVLRQPRSWIS